KLKDFDIEKELEGFAVKEPVFSFDKFPKVNKELGPEMKSTGEGIRFISSLRDPWFRQLYRERSLRLSRDRKSTRLNSSHVKISYAVFCLKKKKRSNIHNNHT